MNTGQINVILYSCERLPIVQAIKTGSFRDISPATAEVLEIDARRRLYELADTGVSRSKGKTDVELLEDRKILRYCTGLAILLVIIVAIYFFSVRPLIVLFKESQKLWCHEVGKREGQRGPFVPYLPMAWKWVMPKMLYGLVLFYYIFGGVINLLAGAFCLEGLSYVITGRTFLFEESANIYSWIPATNTIVFGDAIGRMTGATCILIICLPILMVCATYLRRIMQNIFLIVRVLCICCRSNDDNTTSFMSDYAGTVCSQLGIRTPIMIVRPGTHAMIRLHWLPLNGRAIIEISQDMITLLDLAELKAVLAHELWHIKHGLWKTWLLKCLSSLAMFPNHYLTLCQSWSSQEMKADQFALALTQDPHSLNQALIKLSTAQLLYLNGSWGQQNASRPADKSQPFIGNIRSKWYLMRTSVRFFLGDGLLGYVHPYLSERLEAIEMACENQNNQHIETI